MLRLIEAEQIYNLIELELWDLLYEKIALEDIALLKQFTEHIYEITIYNSCLVKYSVNFTEVQYSVNFTNRKDIVDKIEQYINSNLITIVALFRDCMIITFNNIKFQGFLDSLEIG